MQLKPQDFLVALKLIAWGEQRWTYARLAQELGLSASEAHAAVKRGLQAGLLLQNRATVAPVAEASSAEAPPRAPRQMPDRSFDRGCPPPLPSTP
jgi:hypothetical protein